MFVWKEIYSLQYPQIDVQHKKLFLLGNNVYNAMYKEKDTDIQHAKVKNLLKELKEYTIYHFKFEEDLLTKKEYDKLPQHMAEHKKFIADLEKLGNNLSDQYDKKANFELLKFLSDWITKHIMLVDNDYKKCL